MKLALCLSLSKLIARESRVRRTSVVKQPRQRASAFVLESLENRVLLSATPMDAPTTEPAVTSAVVTTDKADYSPGETAVITTSNTSADGLKFGDGELVQFQVTRTDGIQDYAMGNIPWFVTDGVGGFEAYQEYDANRQAVDRNTDGMADLISPDDDLTVNGSISTNWFVEDQYLNSSLLLTATGQINGAVATTAFTDSGSFTYATTSGFANTVTLAAGATNSTTLNTTVTAPAGNNSFNVSLSFETTAGTTIGIGSGTNQINLTSVTKGFVTSSNSGGPSSFGDSDTFAITVAVGSNVNAGTYHFKATAIESTTGVADGSRWSFDVIVSAAATTTTVSSSDSTSTYGDAVAFTANVTGNPSVGTMQFFVDGNTFGAAVNVINGSATSGSISTLNAGNHNVYAVYSGGTGFTGSTSGTIVQSVSAKAISYTIGNDSHVYGSTTTFSTLATSFLTGVNGETLSIGSYASTGNTTTSNVGTYAITGTVSDGTGLASNYTVALTDGTLTVSAKAISYTIGNDSHVYGSTTTFSTLATSFLTGVNGETLSIGSYASTGNTTTSNVGTYAITGTVSDGTGLASNYTVALTDGTLTVSAKAISYTIGNDSHVYGSTTTFSTLATSFLTGVNGETLSIGSYASTGNTTTSNVGTYAITGTVSDGTGLASNYTVAVTDGTLTVSAKAISYTIGNDSHVYGSTTTFSTLATSFLTGVNGETLSIGSYASTGNTTTSNVGTYAITGTVSDGTGLASNYTVAVTDGTLTVSAKAISYTIGNDSHVYGSTTTFSTLATSFLTGVNGETLSIGSYASTGNTTTSNVGTYAITGTVSDGTGLASNYTVAVTDGTLTVSAKAISYTIGNDSHVYGSTTTFSTLATSFLTGVNGETLSIGSYASTGNTTTSNVGTYAITGTVSDGTGLASNYTVAVTDGTLTVSAKDLTITVTDTTKIFGQTIDLAGALGSTVNTGVNGETLAISYTSAGVPVAALVGPYAINGSVSNGTGMLSNYNVTINSGTLTVMTPSVITTVQDGANLIIVGTGGCDTIAVNATNPSAITVNGVGSYLVGASGHVIVYGMACDDNITLTGNVNLEAHGGDGNDMITGGAGHDVIFGDTGNDTLTGAAGNDVLVGGSGSDRLVGSAGHDLLVAGEMTGTHNGAAYDYVTLRAIDDQWAAGWTDGDLADNTDGDVVDEAASADQLTGSSGHDWFIIGTGDKITDINSATKDGDKIS